MELPSFYTYTYANNVQNVVMYDCPKHDVYVNIAYI